VLSVQASQGSTEIEITRTGGEWRTNLTVETWILTDPALTH